MTINAISREASNFVLFLEPNNPDKLFLITEFRSIIPNQHVNSLQSWNEVCRKHYGFELAISQHPVISRTTWKFRNQLKFFTINSLESFITSKVLFTSVYLVWSFIHVVDSQLSVLHRGNYSVYSVLTWSKNIKLNDIMNII